MPASPSAPHEVQDSFWVVPDGTNMGISPMLLQRTQIASGTNVTNRGTLITQRPVFRKIAIDFGYPDLSQSDFEQGKYQGGAYYKPDNGFESLMFQINGRLFQVTPGSTTASFIDRTIPGDPNPTAPDQAWMWQAEKWLLINDGVSKLSIFDQTAIPTTRRSTWGGTTQFSTYITGANVVVPAVGATCSITVNSAVDLVVNDVVAVNQLGTALVQTIVGTTITLVNINMTPGKNITPAGVLHMPNISWQHQSTELPPGRMGAYVMGQNWITLLDGRQFVASDQVGSSSGTVANNFRDSVLNQTQNLYLAGGGNFAVPGTAGDIRAMAAGAILDASLGQGPLQVFTPNTVFSVNVPTDRLTWQDLTNPILGESIIANGALGQWAVVNANSDFLYRAVDGIRSYAISRRDFNTWGSTPVSREVDPIVSKDAPSSLQFASCVVFDNRMLMTAQPVLGPNGTYWRQIIALNFDPVSSLRGKAPSVYDGSWTGLNVFQLIKGQFSGVERCFCLTYNAITGINELYEILKQDQAYFDNDTVRVTSAFQSAVLLREVPGKTQFDLCRLLDGEIYLDGIRGTTDVQVWYKPDSYPCWVAWKKFSLCNPIAQDDPAAKPGYRTRLGLGQPSGTPCQPQNNRPYRTGHWFQFRFVFTGPFRFLGFKVKACIEPQSQYAKVVGCCENENVLKPAPGSTPVNSGEVVFGNPDDLTEFGDPNSGDVFGNPNP